MYSPSCYSNPFTLEGKAYWGILATKQLVSEYILSRKFLNHASRWPAEGEARNLRGKVVMISKIQVKMTELDTSKNIMI